MISNAAPERLRLFIAIAVPEEVKTEMEKAQAALMRAVPERAVRWARREQFHLTLRFLGAVETQRVTALLEAVGSVCRNSAPLQLRAEGLGFFPGPSRPRMIWAGVRDSAEQLPLLQHAVQSATQGFTAEAPEERFSGHITLGRSKEISRAEAQALANVAAGLANKLFGAWSAPQIEIMRSELSPEGARHTVLAQEQLIARPVFS